MAEVRVEADTRTAFGKGAARRTRRAGKIPAVLYGHGTDPQHLAFDAVEFAAVMRENGRNAVLTVASAGSSQLALTKTVVRDPIKGFIEHVDLLAIRRDERVEVEVPIVTLGEAGPGTLVFHSLDRLTISADAVAIPETVEVVLSGAAVGTQFLAGGITLPEGAELVSDPELLVLNVTEAPSEDDMEAEVDAEGAGVEEDAPEDSDGEGSQRGEGSAGGAPEDPAAAEGTTPGHED